jgi:hypothetical protein
LFSIPIYQTFVLISREILAEKFCIGWGNRKWQRTGFLSGRDFDRRDLIEDVTKRNSPKERRDSSRAVESDGSDNREAERPERTGFRQRG